MTIRLLGIALSVAAVVVLLGSVDIGVTLERIGRANLALLLVGGCVVLCQLAAVTLRWQLLLRRRDAPPIRWSALLRPVSLGYLGNFVLPARLGEVVRLGYVSRRWRLPVTTTLGSIVLERIIDTAVLAMAALGLALVLAAPEWVTRVALVVAVAGAVAIVVLASGAIVPIARWLQTRTATIPRAVGTALEGFLAGAAPDARTAVLPAALISGGSLVLEGTVYWLAARAVSVEVTLPVALLVAAVTVLATAVPAGPAYVGTFELAVTAAAGAVGVPAGAGLAWGVVAHVVTVLPLLVAGIVALVGSGAALDDLVEEGQLAEERLEGRVAT